MLTTYVHSLPSLLGNGFFSWVSVCFNLLVSNCSIPSNRAFSVLSAATSEIHIMFLVNNN